MPTEIDDLAIFGGIPKFSEELPVGQLYFPDWDSYVREMRGIFNREYYTNHGPLTREFEMQLAEFLGVRNALVRHERDRGPDRGRDRYVTDRKGNPARLYIHRERPSADLGRARTGLL